MLNAGFDGSKRTGKRSSQIIMLYYVVRLVGMWIKRREVVNGARSSKSEKLMKHQYME